MAEIRLIPESIQLIKMTDEEYFSDKYKDYISNSRLSLIDPNEDGSPEKYELGNISKYNESFELGSAIHASILQPDLFEISEINKPSGKLGLFAMEVYRIRTEEKYPFIVAIYNASVNADYYAGKLVGARLKTAIKGSLDFYLQRMKFVEKEGITTIFLSKAMKAKYDAIMSNINDPKSEIMKTINPEGLLSNPESYNEYAILCEVDFIDEETGSITRAKLKSKLDNFTIDHETNTITLNDLKTTSKAINYFMGNNVETTTVNGDKVTEWYSGSFQKYHYYRQLGMYLWLLMAAVKHIYKLEYSPKVNLMVVETFPNFASKVYPIEGDYIRAGLKEFKYLLTLVMEWKEKN
ncbi:MAG: hypothetical protein ACOH2V_00930 [Candidatus Saccharimonadaceae bacterium]